MKSVYVLCALLGAVSLLTPTTASARECKPFESDKRLQDCGKWVCRDVGRGLYQCIDFDLKVEWSTDCPGCEGIPPGAEPLRPIKAPAGDHGASCEYFEHEFGTKGADCGAWYCFDVAGDGRWSCNDKSGGGGDWSTDCPECTGSKPGTRPGLRDLDCETWVAAVDRDGDEVSACADGGGLELAGALDHARGFDLDGAEWCSSDVDGGEVCTGDLSDLGIGEGVPSAMKCEGHQDFGGQCKIFCDGMEYWCVNRWVTYQCWGFTAGGAVNPNNTTWGLGSICNSRPAAPEEGLDLATELSGPSVDKPPAPKLTYPSGCSTTLEGCNGEPCDTWVDVVGPETDVGACVDDGLDDLAAAVEPIAGTAAVADLTWCVSDRDGSTCYDAEDALDLLATASAGSVTGKICKTTSNSYGFCTKSCSVAGVTIAVACQNFYTGGFCKAGDEILTFHRNPCRQF